MKFAGTALAALLLVSQCVRLSPEDRTRTIFVGTYIGDELRPDSINPNFSALHRAYYVRTDDGTWELVSDPDPSVPAPHSPAWTSLHLKGDRLNVLDSRKRWDKITFRAEPDRRIGATKNSFLIYIRRADDPAKEDRYDADFTPHESADNGTSMCYAHGLTPEQERQFCVNQRGGFPFFVTKNCYFPCPAEG